MVYDEVSSSLLYIICGYFAIDIMLLYVCFHALALTAHDGGDMCSCCAIWPCAHRGCCPCVVQGHVDARHSELSQALPPFTLFSPHKAHYVCTELKPASGGCASGCTHSGMQVQARVLERHELVLRELQSEHWVHIPLPPPSSSSSS